MARKLGKEGARCLIGWVQNTMLSAKTIAAYFGMKEAVVQQLIDEVRK